MHLPRNDKPGPKASAHHERGRFVQCISSKTHSVASKLDNIEEQTILRAVSRGGQLWSTLLERTAFAIYLYQRGDTWVSETAIYSSLVTFAC